MPEPQIGDSKKKGLATMAIISLAALQPKTKYELVTVGCITVIAIVGILVFAYLEKKG